MVWHRRNIHGQSAIEYLATYGWVLLILAIALGVLYFLGVFNSNAYVAKASPYSCTVSRPYGPNSTAYITLSGVCDNEIPEYVAKFNGQSSSVEIPYNPALQPLSQFTLTLWVYIEPYQGPPPTKYGSRIYMDGGGGSDQGWEIDVPSTDLGSTAPVTAGIGIGSSEQSLTGTVPTGSWQFLSVVFNANAGRAYMYNNANASPIGTLSFTPGTDMNAYIGNEVIGAFGNSPFDNFNGSISNIQLYNASLSANGIRALYSEGIGGAPIELSNLVAWWQLNGNSNDTSGDLNNGASTNVIFTNTWYSTYS